MRKNNILEGIDNVKMELNQKMRYKNGITLIVLIITIVVLLILAGVSIGMLTGENGLIKKALEAKEQTEIKAYLEKIEIIKAELKLNNEGYAVPTIEQIKNELDTNHTKWVSSTEIIIDKMDNDVKKLKLTTKEGYIFYVTSTTTEYKGKVEYILPTDISADMVSFTPENISWQVDNVKDALDYLFNN